ncbi:MAG TPA: RND transporter, partial [Planctomycetota bacterium]|nr:RND transporter [Planctomycetota bacterium]
MRPLMAFLLGGLAACAAPPPVRPPDPPVELPPAWTAGGTTPEGSPPGWWRAFQDERLDAYIEEAALRSFDLRAAAARLDQAVAQARIAGSDWLDPP